jgi:hypothetical protein
MRIECEGFLDDDQCGFRQGKGCRDQIVILTEVLAQLQEAAKARGEQLNPDVPLASIAYLDYIAAFDSIDHVFLDEALQHGGASNKTRAIIRSIYRGASAVVRATDSAGQTAMSEPFSVDRGVVQGDIVSPYCFIMALQLIFLQCDDRPDQGIVLQEGTESAVRVKSLKYADDIATISPNCAQTSQRITLIANKSFSMGTLEAHKVKSEHMPVMQEGAFGGGSVCETDIKNANFSHVCEHCDRSFSTHQGLVTHTSRWCGEAERESFPNDYQVDYILDARGPPDNRFYHVKWAGSNTSAQVVADTLPGDPWPSTWEPARYLDTAPHAIDNFWLSSRHALTDTIEDPDEFRCVDCSRFCKSATGLGRHRSCCKSVPGSRNGQKTVGQVLHLRRCDVWSRMDTAEMGNLDYSDYNRERKSANLNLCMYISDSWRKATFPV